jgi:hypothetical protein
VATPRGTGNFASKPPCPRRAEQPGRAGTPPTPHPKPWSDWPKRSAQTSQPGTATDGSTASTAITRGRPSSLPTTSSARWTRTRSASLMARFSTGFSQTRPPAGTPPGQSSPNCYGLPATGTQWSSTAWTGSLETGTICGVWSKAHAQMCAREVH